MIDYGKIDELCTRLPGWCTPEKGRRLAELVAGSGAKQVVELGVFGGRSLCALALGCKARGNGVVHGYDPYSAPASLEGTNDRANDEWWSKVDYEDILRAARDGIAQGGLESHAQIIRNHSLAEDVLVAYPAGSVDVLHQDSNHSEEISTAEVRVWSPRVRLGGYWAIDDINWATTAAAQKLLQSMGFRLLEDHGTWAIYQKVAA